MTAKVLDSGSKPDGATRSDPDDRGACYRFLAGLILDDPTNALLEGLSGGEIADLLAGTLQGAGIELVASGLGAMRAFLDSRKGIPPETVRTQLAVERTRLFRGISGGFGPPPPYETLHRAGEGISEGELLLRLLRFYQEAGVGLPDGYVERPDYLALEMDLMGYLCAEESLALARWDTEAVDGLHDCQRRFLEQHILRWVPAYCRLLAKDAGCDYYVGAAHLLEGFLASEAALFGVRRDRSTD